MKYERYKNDIWIEINELGTKTYYDGTTLNWHREDGPAIEYANGNKIWYQNGKRHRLDGPAIETNDRLEWWINGNCHKIDGPAIKFIDGEQWWFFEGKRIECSSQQEFEKILKLKLFW